MNRFLDMVKKEVHARKFNLVFRSFQTVGCAPPQGVANRFEVGVLHSITLWLKILGIMPSGQNERDLAGIKHFTRVRM